ncbi:hypothetical protein GCM10008938_42370 [Deinococcus roseus]|uniref:Uncharacterized protein n=2 Tax=Deinococcus roseus TaxID=392414 RepID=A0ABQ2DBZ7_9DEIO|nr:hypothetical protein GCM10008938_42370 [Deinococcus roseus]
MLIKTQKFDLLWTHLLQQKSHFDDGFEFEGEADGHPLVEIRFQGMLIWVDFREVSPSVRFWGIGFEDVEVYQQKEAEFEYGFNDGYQECFGDDQEFFAFLDGLLSQISEGTKLWMPPQ